MSEAFVQCVGGGVDDVGRGVEIRFADFQVNNVTPFRLQGACFHQDFECRLRSETGHSIGKTKFGQLIHDRPDESKPSPRSLAVI